MTQALIRSLIATATIGLLLSLGYFFLRSDVSGPLARQPPPTTIDVQDISGEPDLRLGGATITEFDLSGNLKYRLHAKQMSRFEATTETALTEPRLLVHSDSGAPWNVESRTGMIRDVLDPVGEMENVVLLREDVVLRQLDKVSGRSLLVVRSAAIDLFPARQFAKSPVSVMIDSDVGRTQAASMQGDLKTGQLHLSSDAQQPVHSIVLPTQFKSSK